MSELNTNTLSVDYTLDENTGAARTAQIYTEVDGEVVDVLNVTQAASAEYEDPSTGPGSDITIDMSTETQQAINAIKAKIANFRSLLNTTAYTTVKDKTIETIDYYKNQFDNGNTDSYNCVQIVNEYPLEIINSYYIELNYLLENYDKVQNFLAELTGNIADLKINNINRTLNNLEEDYNNLKEVTKETSELTQAIIDSFSNDNIVSPDEQLTLKLKLDEIVTEYASISTSVHALIAAYEEANTPKVDENGEEHKEAFIAEDVAEYLEKLTTAFEAYQTNYNNAYKILSYYTNEATERDDFGNIVIIPECNLNDLPLFYDVRQKLLDIYYEANSYYTTYNRFGSKTTWIGKDGIYSGTIMADNLRGWCIEGLTVQSGIKSELPTDLEWYKYNGKEATNEADAFTKITADYRDENGNPVINGPTWQIYKDGTGHLAKGGIRWNNDEVIFGDSTKISITMEDGTKTAVPLGEKFSDMSEKIDGYISEWENDNIISYTEQRSMLTVATEIRAEHKQITNSISNLINNLREAQDKIDVDTTDSVIETYINSLNVTEYLNATNKALAAIEYYTKEDVEGTFRSVTGSVEISADYPLSDISDYYDVRETIVEKYNLAADFYTNNINTILSGVIKEVELNKDTLQGYIDTWASDKLVSPAELAEFRVLYNTIKSEKADIILKVQKLDEQYAEYIANIDDANIALKDLMNNYKASLDYTSYTVEADDVLNTLNYYIMYKASEEDINTYGEGFIPINTEYPLEDLYEYYDVKDALVENYNEAFAVYTTYTNTDLINRIDDLSKTNENIDKFIADWADNNNVDPAEQTEMEYIGKEIVAETPTLITAAALSISNLAAVEKKIADSEMTEDDELLTNIEDTKKRLNSTVFANASSAAQRVINYYVNSKKDSNGFIALNEKYPLDDIDKYYTERENLTQAINEADSLCQTYNDIAINNVIGGLSDTDTKITEYIATWKDDKLISPAERSELGRILSEILVEEAGIIASVKDITDKLNDILTTDGDKIGTDIKYKINEIIDTLDTTTFKTAADNAETVLQYYTTTANIEDNGFIKIIEDQKLEVVEIYYKEREAVKNSYNVALSFYNAYNKSSINILNKDLEDYAKKMDEFIDAVSSDGFIDANERRQFQIYRAEIVSDSKSLDAAATSLRTDLNTLAATTGNMYITEINKHLDAISIGILGFAESALATLDYYINATPDKNNLVKIDNANSLDSINRYYSKAAELNGALNAASSFHARTVGDYSNKKITVAQEKLAQLETDLRKLEVLQGADNEEVNNWIKAWIDDGTLNSEELKDLRLKYEDISAEYNIVNPAIENTISWLNTHKNDTINNGEITEYLNKLNTAHATYLGAFNAVKNAVNYYFSDEAIKDPDTGCVQLSDAHPLSVFSTYVGARENAVTINNEASSFVTTHNRFGSKLTWLGDDGIYTGDFSADQITGWCLRGLTFQSAENSKTKVPDNVKWYEYHPEADSENNAFTEHTGGSGAPRWQLYKDGSGYVADGQISWQGGNVTLGDKVKIKWANVDGGKDYVDGQNNTVNEKINTLNTELNKLDTQVSILSNLTGGSTSVLNEFIDIWTNDDYIDSNEIAQISKEYNQLNAEYTKVLGIAKDLNRKLQEAANRTNLDPTDADYLPYPADDFTNDIVNLENLEDLYGKAKDVYEYYTNPENLVKDEEGKSKGYVLRDANHDINAFATYYAEQTDVVSKCNVGLSNLQQHTRFGSKFTYIGSDGIYSGSIAADQITGLVTTSTAAQSSKEDVLPKDLVWYEKTETGFNEITGDGTTKKGPLWQLWAEGSGHLAKGNISWDAEGNINVGNIAADGGDVNIGSGVGVGPWKTFEKNGVSYIGDKDTFDGSTNVFGSDGTFKMGGSNGFVKNSTNGKIQVGSAVEFGGSGSGDNEDESKIVWKISGSDGSNQYEFIYLGYYKWTYNTIQSYTEDRHIWLQLNDYKSFDLNTSATYSPSITILGSTESPESISVGLQINSSIRSTHSYSSQTNVFSVNAGGGSLTVTEIKQEELNSLVKMDDLEEWWDRTTIDGGKITTGSIDANRINVDNLTVKKLNTTTDTSTITPGTIKIEGNDFTIYNNNSSKLRPVVKISGVDTPFIAKTSSDSLGGNIYEKQTLSSLGISQGQTIIKYKDFYTFTISDDGVDYSYKFDSMPLVSMTLIKPDNTYSSLPSIYSSALYYICKSSTSIDTIKDKLVSTEYLNMFFNNTYLEPYNGQKLSGTETEHTIYFKRRPGYPNDSSISQSSFDADGITNSKSRFFTHYVESGITDSNGNLLPGTYKVGVIQQLMMTGVTSDNISKLKATFHANIGKFSIIPKAINRCDISPDGFRYTADENKYVEFTNNGMLKLVNDNTSIYLDGNSIYMSFGQYVDEKDYGKAFEIKPVWKEWSTSGKNVKGYVLTLGGLIDV